MRISVKVGNVEVDETRNKPPLSVVVEKRETVNLPLAAKLLRPSVLKLNLWRHLDGK